MYTALLFTLRIFSHIDYYCQQIIVVAMWILWNKTKFGKYMYAIGGNPEAAQVSGQQNNQTFHNILPIHVHADKRQAVVNDCKNKNTDYDTAYRTDTAGHGHAAYYAGCNSIHFCGRIASKADGG